MADRIKSLLPIIFILIILSSLINIGAIPGKEAILRFLGLGQSDLEEQGRPLDYVPGRLLELQPSGGTELALPSPSPNERVVTPTPSPSPQTSPLSSPNLQAPPPPPPEIFGAKIGSMEVTAPSPPENLIGEVNSPKQTESYLETFKNFFSGIF